MAINLGGGFHIGSKQAIDDRLILTKDEMLNINENTFPDVYMCVCSDDGAIYTFNINNETNDETGKFRIAEGGNGSSVDCYTKSEINTKLDDYTKTEDLSLVATTGSYNDLLDKPSVLEITDIIDDTNTEATDKTLSSSKIIDEIQSIIDDTFDNKEVLDLLTESDTGKLQYNGVTISGEGGANTAGSVEYVNDVVNSYTVEEALNKLIADFYYVESSITSFTASPAGGTYEVGTTISSPTFNWNYNKNIITQTLTDCTLADETVRTATYAGDITTNKTFTLTANDGRNNVSSSISYSFVYPYYVGVATTNKLTETDVIALTKKVESKGNKTINYTTSQSYMVFAYPMSYGDISKVVDQNGFDVTGSFTQSTVNINGTYYYVRCSNKCSGSYTMTFKY